MNRVAVAKRLIELRSNKSQEEVANSVNISASALSMYENGERIPRDEIKIRLAKYYGKTVQYIFFNENDT
uniref:Helix-turn-helix XRE-family like protein n=1 Tax=Siphoviridae sp. ctGyV19 TaxID=2826225 RepID=A0A8S5MVA9_9CAUD|nr:MAG TPA: helix-turn-helix XRE-family like protein [Siphoviridae sp. ctGyV19]